MDTTSIYLSHFHFLNTNIFTTLSLSGQAYLCHTFTISTSISLPHFHFLDNHIFTTLSFSHDKHIFATLSLSRQAYLCHTFTFYDKHIFAKHSLSQQAYLIHTFTLSTSIFFQPFHFLRHCSVSIKKVSVMIQDRKSCPLLDRREKLGENSWLIRLVDGVNGEGHTKEN